MMLKKTFKIRSDYEPCGDQPYAIEKLAEGSEQGLKYQTLLGVTGSGKTFTMANVIAKLGKPALVIAHNKTLAAQLCSEFKDFLPENAVEYFVSYYDYYQPEAYLPSTDTYIEKDSSINDEIERLRHSATTSLLTRRDVVVVASVSCIYGLGSPAEYLDQMLMIKVGDSPGRDRILRKLIEIQYERNDIELARGRFRVKGDVIDLVPAYLDRAIRIELFGDEIERITEIDVLTGQIFSSPESVVIYPATHYVTSADNLKRAIQFIKIELEDQLKELNGRGKMLEAHRLNQRTNYDLEMLKEMKFCKGIENYSRHIDSRQPGEPPNTLLDFFPDDFIVFIDESHNTVPQIHGMHEGDRSRKTTLVEYGFRLPSAIDNRPLKFEEFVDKVPQCIFVSATPGRFETETSGRIVEQLIRPTGLIDPAVEVRPIEGQIDDLMAEVKERVKKSERVLVTTLTKKMAEDLTDYLTEMGIKVRYLHSDIDTIERMEIVRDLRLGIFDVLVGINLLREGLDIPEVSLVAILDADKEGFLRGETALIQTIGRAARHVEGKVIMYADRLTDSMKRSIVETDRRRGVQAEFNVSHGIVPKGIIKGVADVVGAESRIPYGAKKRQRRGREVDPAEIEAITVKLEEEMHFAAEELRFEYAAKLRDEIEDLKKVLKENITCQKT